MMMLQEDSLQQGEEKLLGQSRGFPLEALLL